MPDAQAELLTRDLLAIFNERNEAKRLAVVEEIYTSDAVFYEKDASFKGYEAINKRVTDVLAAFPPDFLFSVAGDPSRNHNVARLAWSLGPKGGPVVATGIDIGILEGHRIAALYVFIDGE